jgi:hypothetical protein
MMASIDSGARVTTKEPAYRLHETGTQSALVMHFPILPDRNLSKNFRGPGEARDIDRLIAG